MGSGTKFKFSHVLPNVFSKIKGIRKTRKPKGSSSSPTPSELSETEQNDISMASKRDRSPSPVRTFPQRRDRDMVTQYSPSSPDRSPRNQKTFDIRFPAESPIRGRRSSSARPHSPGGDARKLHIQVDPGRCSYDSAMAFIPHDGRVRRAAPQAFGKCLIMAKCNSFNGSTHSDSEVSETDTSRVHRRRTHSRSRSVQLDETSWERERDGYHVGTTTADESASQGSDTASARQRRRERKVKETGQFYTPSTQVHNVHSRRRSLESAAKRTTDPTAESRGACANSSRDGTDVEQSGVHGRLSRPLSFTTDDNLCRQFDEISFSSDDEFYKVRRQPNFSSVGQYRLRSTGNAKSFRNEDTDTGYASSEVVVTEDERSHVAKLRREAILAKTVRNASDRLARVQSRFSDDGGRGQYDLARIGLGLSLTEDETMSHASAAYRREASLVKTVLSAQDWARENVRALAKANQVDRDMLARLRATPLDHFVVQPEELATDNFEHEIVGLPPNSRGPQSRGRSRNPSPIVEKHTKGRIDYASTSPHPCETDDDSSKQHKITSFAVYEEFAPPATDCSRDLPKSAPPAKLGTELAKTWDAEFPPFPSNFILVESGGRRMEGGKLEGARLPEFSESDARTPRIVTHTERGKTAINTSSKISSGCAFPPTQEVITAGLKNFKQSKQSRSPRLSHESAKNLSPFEEFASVDKVSSRSLSPVEESTSKMYPSPDAFYDRVKKSSRSPSPVHDQPAAAKELNARADAGMQRLDSVAVVKASYDPYHDFRESMVEMILQNDIRTAADLEDLLQCYLSLNSSEYHKIIVQVFSDIWSDIFDQ